VWAVPGQTAAMGEGRSEVRCAAPRVLRLPRRWLDNKADPRWREDLAALIDETPELDSLLLTKRIENFDRLAPWHNGRATYGLALLHKIRTASTGAGPYWRTFMPRFISSATSPLLGLSRYVMRTLCQIG
jgi:hypothetical protein